jgi:acyl-CoA thioesterase FadM
LIGVEFTVEELEEKSVRYGFRIFKQEVAVLLANGQLTIVAADKQTRRAVQISLEFAEKLKPFNKQDF